MLTSQTVHLVYCIIQYILIHFAERIMPSRTPFFGFTLYNHLKGVSFKTSQEFGQVSFVCSCCRLGAVQNRCSPSLKILKITLRSTREEQRAQDEGLVELKCHWDIQEIVMWRYSQCFIGMICFAMPHSFLSTFHCNVWSDCRVKNERHIRLT